MSARPGAGSRRDAAEQGSSISEVIGRGPDDAHVGPWTAGIAMSAAEEHSVPDDPLAEDDGWPPATNLRAHPVAKSRKITTDAISAAASLASPRGRGRSRTVIESTTGMRPKASIPYTK
jgi:hypothetical protein